MDDVDAVQAQISYNMLQSGDWVTARLDGVAYLEKPPLKYWMIAASLAVFGFHDWAARIPIALCTVLLCWLTARIAAWAFGPREGLYAGLILATCVGLFLFTRVLIPDVILTLSITLALWSLLRATDEGERRPGPWALALWGAMAAGVLLKGLIAAVFPVAAGAIYLLLTRQLFERQTWQRLRPTAGVLLFLLIAAPWHVLATLHNPPYFDFSMHSESGSYHGFFWFYFINEHLLRFLNLRYPRDYNTVPRAYFWLFHLLWLFPWSLYFPAVLRLEYRKPDRASRTRLMAACWCGFILLFFTFSTTQEYYSLPCYPALALLLASALTSGHRSLRRASLAIAAISAVAAGTCWAILWMVRGMAAPGDIAQALTQNPELYTLSLGHMADLTLGAFAYLRLPLAVAGGAFALGATGIWLGRGKAPQASGLPASAVAMMVLFFHAARLALVVFDPYMSSRPLAEALVRAPVGKLIVDDQYYTFSSVLFYAAPGMVVSDARGSQGYARAKLLNGRVNNLEYGSYAPDGPKDVFIDDAALERLWSSAERYYLVAEGPRAPALAKLLENKLTLVKAAGGKFLFTNF